MLFLRLGLAIGLISVTSFAQTSPMAYTGAKILPVTGDPIETGVIVIQDGKILALGPVGTTAIPTTPPSNR